MIDNRQPASPSGGETGAAIYLNSVLPLPGSPTDNVVRIGTTGHVISDNGLAIYTVGAGTSIRNQGLVEGYGAIQTSGNGQTIRNDGTVNFGVQGIGLAGQTTGAISTVINTGILRHVAALDDPDRGDIAVNINIDNVRMVNSGLIEAGGGIISGGSNIVVINSGTINTTDAAVSFNGGSNCSLTNNGTINSSDSFALAAVVLSLGDNLVANNTGTITSAGRGIAGDMTRVLNSGDIVAADIGVFDFSAKKFALTNSGLIVGGTVGVSAYAEGDVTGSVVVNTGTISGQFGGGPTGLSVQMQGDIGRIINQGTLVGNVEMYCARNAVANAGTIQGDIVFFGDVNVYAATGSGVVTGDIIGNGGTCRFQGGTGIDRLFGGESGDILNGGGGNDVIVGGTGQDVLTGGMGADSFIFAMTEDIRWANRSDRITDFQSGIDHIDLSAFMAGGRFIGAALFSGTAGEVRYAAATGVVFGDVNGDRLADWSLSLANRAALTGADFIF